MMHAASVIVRAKNERDGIAAALDSLRAQTVPLEIVVVDSGSVDGTLEIAAERCDRLVRIPAAEFTYGRALNVGARAASAPILFALSAHCVAPDPGWAERSLALYERPDVAATNGATRLPDGTPLSGTFYQTAAEVARHPLWGFSNHGASWRRAVWEEIPFDEELDAAEDKTWAAQVVQDSRWVIAYREDLMVSMAHRWQAGAIAYFRRLRTEARALSRLAELPPYRFRDLARDWWREIPDDRHSALAHRFGNHVRLAGLLGRYVGRREGAAPAADPSRRR